jgi:hypothetical protein
MAFRRTALLAALLLWQSPAHARDYFLSARGDDRGDGSGKAPWRTVSRVNLTSFQPGDRILLEGGSTFEGPLELGRDDRGTPARKVVVTSSGSGRAVINGGKRRAVSVDGCDHVAIRHLTLVGAGRETGNTADGLYLAHSVGSAVDDVEARGFRHAGIQVSGTRNTRITRVRAHQNGYAGINAGGDPSQHLYIGYCLAENNPGDPSILDNHSGSGIIVSRTSVALVERCEAAGNGWDQPWKGNGPVGIWTYDSDRVTIQHCISHHNRSTASDGGGFDLDGGVTNSVLQYNYSHNNFGAGYLICQYEGAPRFANNVVRYNVSRDDGLSDHNSGIFVWVGGSGMESALVHNNTVWNTKGSAVGYGIDRRFAANLPEIAFHNNIFVSLGPQIYNRTEENGKLGRFRANLYWAVGERGFRVGPYRSLEEWAAASGQESIDGRLVGLFADPALPIRGPALLTKPTDLNRLEDYRLGKGSPAIGAGLDLRRFGIDPGLSDFYGNALPENAALSVGAHDARPRP